MAYQFSSSWNFNPLPIMNNFFTNCGFSSFPTFESFGPFIPLQFSPNDQIPEREIELGIPIKNSETREILNREAQPIRQIELKRHREMKTKKRSRNVHKELESAKKNCESNLVNQFLSYFSSPGNSSELILKALRKMKLDQVFIDKKLLDQAISFFCKQISIVNSRKERKYVNKAFLQNYFLEIKLENYMPDILQNVAKTGLMTKGEFCELFRRCCFHFFRTVSVSSVTSSAKLNPISRPQHIKRRRLIVESFSKN